MCNNKGTKEGVLTFELQSWRDFHGLIDDYFSNSPAYIFRGQADNKWLIESTLDRKERQFPTTPNHRGTNPTNFNRTPASRKKHLKAFKEVCVGKHKIPPPVIGENGNVTYDYDDEYWALARHHGLAAPLLDWTRSPFVALFFAFEKENEINPQENRVVYALSRHAILDVEIEESTEKVQVYLPNIETSVRLTVQSGLFLKMPLPKWNNGDEEYERTNLEGYVRKNFQKDTYSQKNRHSRPILIKIVIKNEARIDCLKMLNKMNINRMTLFPDLDGAADYINALWELDFDSSFGY